MKFNERDWTVDHLHQYRQASNKPGIQIDTNNKRECPFCKQPEYRGQFRNGRCRPCRKAQK